MERVSWNQAVRPSTHDLIAAINSVADDIDRIDGALDDIETDLDGKAGVSGTYPDFVAGEALSIRSGIRSNTFLSRALDTDVANGIAEVDRILGNTVVWNQLGYQGDFPSADSIWQASTSGVSISRPGGEITATSSANSVPPGIKTYSSPIADKLISGHKYYVSIEAKGSRTVAMSLYSESVTTNQVFAQTSISETTFTRIEGIVNFVRQENYNGVRISGRGSDAVAGDWVTIRNLMIIDLTIMFGAGNEPTFTNQFLQQYPEDYYAYTPTPYLLSSNIAGINDLAFPQKTLRGVGIYRDTMTNTGIERVIKELVITGNEGAWVSYAYQNYTGFYKRLLDESEDHAPYISVDFGKNFTPGNSYVPGPSEAWIGVKNPAVFLLWQNNPYETSADFEAWLQQRNADGNPVTFVYATSHPTTETFAEPIDLTYRVESDGTEAWILPEGETSAAVTGEIAYPLDPARALITHESFADFIDKLGAYLGATITETWDGSKYTYSFASGRSTLLGSIDAEPDALEVTEKDDMVEEIIENERKEQ